MAGKEWWAAAIMLVAFGAEAGTLPERAGQPGTVQAGAVATGSVFRDCPDCPEMVVIPAGSFLMGSSAEEVARATAAGERADWYAYELPPHRITLSKPLAMGRYPVTRAEYAAFQRDTGQSSPKGCSPMGAVDEHHPQVCVSWDDSRAYARWLSERTGKTYRLPSEAEWEYAARAGTTSTYYWGDSVGAGHAVCVGCGSPLDGKQTAAVGTFPPNGWGLFDMAGNVWQWTADFLTIGYGGVSANSSSGHHVVRGGSWNSTSWTLRSANRFGLPPENRDYSVGFRVARDLP